MTHPAASVEAARDETLRLLATRLPGATVCPSEVARALAAATPETDAEWRAMMPVVHAAVDRLIDEGQARLSWQGKPLAARSGPYRIGLSSGGS